MLRILRATLIVVVTIVLSTLATNALDMGGSLGDSVIGTALAPLLPERSKCPEGMSYVGSVLGDYCIDTYEASPGDKCVHQVPSNPSETRENLATKGCMPVSKTGRVPWRYISLTQAQQACALAGKRLPNAEEWYRAALGTPDPDASAAGNDDCNVNRNRADGIDVSGEGNDCVSPLGVHDMVGNAWEWVDEAVKNAQWRDRTLPATGYVVEANASGEPTKTDPTSPSEDFGKAKLWSNENIEAGIMRGGFYASRDDAGIFAFHAASPPSFVGEAVGFRCVVEAQ